MEAIVYRRHGSSDVLQLRDVERPSVQDNGVLIRVQAASVNRSDWETLTARPVYELSEVPGALKRLGEGHALGKIVINM